MFTYTYHQQRDIKNIYYGVLDIKISVNGSVGCETPALNIVQFYEAIGKETDRMYEVQGNHCRAEWVHERSSS